MTVKYKGILASIDWNSNKWQKEGTEADIAKSNFSFVKENGFSYTSFNFGHKMFATDIDGYYSGLVPHFFNRTPDSNKFKDVDIVFFKSVNWENLKHYIVGFYAYPILERGVKPPPVANYKQELVYNLKSLPENIILLENFLCLTEHHEATAFIPEGKKFGKQSYNYMTKENVQKLLEELSKLNTDDLALSELHLRLKNDTLIGE